MEKITSELRVRMSAKDAHYGGNLVDGAHMPVSYTHLEVYKRQAIYPEKEHAEQQDQGDEPPQRAGESQDPGADASAEGKQVHRQQGQAGQGGGQEFAAVQPHRGCLLYTSGWAG